MKFPWVGWLLSKVHSKLLQDRESNYRTLEEGNQVCMERRLWWCIPGIEEVVNYITSASAAWHLQVFQRIMSCFWHWIGMCPNARRASDFVFIAIVVTPWRALPNSWSWVSGSCVSTVNMATLLACECGTHLHGPQKLEVHLHSTELEHETAKMSQVNQGLWVGSALSSGKSKCSCGCAEP
jgi:hypothetical protein